MGDNVVITGNYFINVTSVTFSSFVAAASYTVNSATQITATVPSEAVNGVITVTTATGFATVNFTMKSWHDISSKLSPGSTPHLLDVTFSGNHVWIAGTTPGELYYSSDGGNNFATVPLPAASLRSRLSASGAASSNDYVTSLFMKSYDNVWGVTQISDKTAGRVLHWNVDGSSISSVGSGLIGLNSIHFPLSGNIGYCCGGSASSSYVGEINASTPSITSFPTPYGGQTEEPLISFPDPSDKIWIAYNGAGSSTIYEYNGSSWVHPYHEMGSVSGLCFVDKSNGWAVGVDLKSSMAAIFYYDGSSWTSRYISTDDTMQLQDVFFRNTTEGWAVGFNSSNPRNLLVLHSTDGGINWTKQLETPAGLISLETLKAVYFSSDGSTGFAVGNNKKIYKYY